MAGPSSAELPRSVAIILDGNSRWAAARGLPTAEGHRAGTRALRRTVEASIELGIESLTVYAFSTENWRRPETEVSFLMTLLERTIDGELPDLQAKNVRFRVIGRAAGIPAGVRRRVENVVEETACNTGLTLVLALNYGGRDELVDAVRRVARDVRSGAVDPEQIDETTVSRALYTDGMPDPDLLIRTSGEMRVSNFLLWQIAYTELWVTPTLWPDFGVRDLCMAVADYQRRDRRFGRV